MRIYAHRGHHAGSDAPQNSMEAFRRAAGAGYGIETDLRHTADGVVVLHHDRCCAGRPVSQMTKSELDECAGIEVTTLSDLLSAGLGVPLNLDVKTMQALRNATADMLAASTSIALVSAFHHDIVVEAAILGLPAGYLMASRPSRDAPLPLSRPGVGTCVWDYDMIDPSLSHRSAKSGFSNASYGAVTEHELARLDFLGFAIAITDNPDAYRPGQG